MAENTTQISAEDEAKFQARFEAEQQLANPQPVGSNEPANTSFIANSGIPEAYGLMSAGSELLAEHPIAAGLGAAGAAKLIGQIPGVSPTMGRVAQAVVPGYGFAKDIATGAMNAAQDFAGHYGARNAAFDNRTYQSLANKLASLEGKGITSGPAYTTLVDELERMKALRSAAGAPIAPSSAGMNTAQQGINNMIRGGTVPTQAAPQASSYAQLAQRFAPAMQKVAPMLEGAGKLLAPAAIAKELFYTSPEEVQQLKEMRQSGNSLKDRTNQKMQEISTSIREAAARKALGQ